MRQHLDAVMDYMDRKFDSHAPIAGMEQIDETVLSVDMDRKFDSYAPIAGTEQIDETVLSVDKEEDLEAEGAEERAQTMSVEEDTAMAVKWQQQHHPQQRNKIAGAETNKNKIEKKGAEAKEEGHVAEEDRINIQKMDVEEDKAETEEASTTTSHKSSRKQSASSSARDRRRMNNPSKGYKMQYNNATGTTR